MEGLGGQRFEAAEERGGAALLGGGGAEAAALVAVRAGELEDGGQARPEAEELYGRASVRRKKLGEGDLVRLASEYDRFSHLGLEASLLSGDLDVLFGVVSVILAGGAATAVEGVVQDLNPEGASLKMRDAHRHAAQHWVL